MKRQAVIYKYPLALSVGVQDVRLPGRHPKVKHIDIVNNQIFMWVEVDPGEGMLVSNFKVVATGEAWSAEAWDHVGTVLMDGGAYVWHVLQAVKL